MSKEALAILLVVIVLINMVAYSIVRKDHRKVQLRLKALSPKVVLFFILFGGANGGFIAATHSRSHMAGNLKLKTVKSIAIAQTLLVMAIIAKVIFVPDLSFSGR